MPTQAFLDATRTELIEPHFSYSRRAADIETGQFGKLRVWQSPLTKSWLLQPISMTSDFRETDDWEALKFRLADIQHDADWWTETPEWHNKDKQGDYYLSLVVKSS